MLGQEEVCWGSRPWSWLRTGVSQPKPRSWGTATFGLCPLFPARETWVFFRFIVGKQQPCPLSHLIVAPVWPPGEGHRHLYNGSARSEGSEGEGRCSCGDIGPTLTKSLGFSDLCCKKWAKIAQSRPFPSRRAGWAAELSVVLRVGRPQGASRLLAQEITCFQEAVSVVWGLAGSVCWTRAPAAGLDPEARPGPPNSPERMQLGLAWGYAGPGPLCVGEGPTGRTG